MSMKLSTKLIGSFVIVAVITLVVGIIGINGIGEIGKGLQDLGQNSLPSVEGLLVMMQAQSDVVVGERGILNDRIFADPSTRNAQYEWMKRAWVKFEEGWKRYEETPQSDQEALEWKNFQKAYENWKQEHEKFIGISEKKLTMQKSGSDSIQNGHIADELFEQALISRKYFLESNEHLSALVEMNKKMAATSVEKGFATAKSANTMGIIGMVVGFALALALGIFLSTSVSKQLNRIISGLSSGSEQVASAANQVSGSSQQLAEGANEQASRSAEAAKDTAALIEESQKNSEQGVSVSVEAAEAIKAISESSVKVANLISEIAAASKEQATGVDQINTAVAQMDKVTQSNRRMRKSRLRQVKNFPLRQKS